MSIIQAVGRNAPNQSDDVAIIQALLNLNEHLLHGLPLLTVDGSFGPRTQDTIDEFQRLEATPGETSGVIKPGSPTLTALLAPVDGLLTPRVLQALMPLSSMELAERYCAPLVTTMAAAQIDTPLRRAHFLAQLGHESGSLRYSSEIASGQKYEGRADLGNTSPGDGPRFKGRGLIQITGRANYTAYGKARGRDFITGNNPLLLATEPELAADCAGWFWTTRRLNAIADADDVEKITKRINGGRNGLPDRVRRLRIAKTVLIAPTSG